MKDVRVELFQSSPGSGEGGAGQQKGFHSSFMVGHSAPTPWQGAQSTLVPGDPVSRECLHPVPPREQPRLGCCLLYLPGGGPTCPEVAGGVKFQNAQIFFGT